MRSVGGYFLARSCLARPVDVISVHHGAPGAEGLELLAAYSPSELAAIEKFMTDALALQQNHLDRLSQGARPQDSGLEQPSPPPRNHLPKTK
jgi:hypothetical protein